MGDACGKVADRLKSSLFLRFHGQILRVCGDGRKQTRDGAQPLRPRPVASRMPDDH